MNERLFYNQLQTLFAGELATLEYGEKVLHGVDNLVSWESWHRLRSVQKLSVRKSKGVIEATLSELLRKPAMANPV